MNALDPNGQRLALVLEYDGCGFSGWQQQPGRRTVQGALETALSSVANHPLEVVCAGRTDAGVHALAQVVHFDSAARRAPYNWVMGGNAALPRDLRILSCREVPPRFHARASAIARHYRYTVLNRRIPSALDHGRVTWVPYPLDAQRMHEAAQPLVGHHDFSAFRAQGCQSKSPRRWLYQIEVQRDGDRVHVDVCANAFLHHMVRNLVGSLLEIGLNRQAVDWMAALLRGRDRRLAGVTAPPDGLYFAGILYPNALDLPRSPFLDRLPVTLGRFEPSQHPADVSLDENSR